MSYIKRSLWCNYKFKDKKDENMKYTFACFCNCHFTWPEQENRIKIMAPRTLHMICLCVSLSGRILNYCERVIIRLSQWGETCYLATTPSKPTVLCQLISVSHTLSWWWCCVASKPNQAWATKLNCAFNNWVNE